MIPFESAVMFTRGSRGDRAHVPDDMPRTTITGTALHHDAGLNYSEGCSGTMVIQW